MAKKQIHLFVFLGESMGLQSAFGFIWPLFKTNSIQLTVLINAVKSFCSYKGSNVWKTTVWTLWPHIPWILVLVS
jgi:hypothetical protein